jgi:GlpG protein
MRQLGTLGSESDARRLAAWLVTQRIDAHAEPAGDAWAVWVRDEDRLAEARAALEHFRTNPQDERYRVAPGAAERLRREEEQNRQKALGNIVEMRSRWGSGASAAARRCPLVIGLIGASILVSLAANSLVEEHPRPSVLFKLLFVDPMAAISHESIGSQSVDMWASIRRGEVWRLVTPVFTHYGIFHLLFNMLWLYELGGQIENRRGTWRFLWLVLALAVLANAGQAAEADIRGVLMAFGGMSGVVYGLFGYVLVKVKFDNREHYRLSQANITIMILWFVLCLAREFAGPEGGLLSFMPNIANSAHTAGLFAGMGTAYAPLVLRARSP